LAAAISELVVDADRRRAMGERAAESVRRKFDIGRRVREMEAVYEELLTQEEGAISKS
jgi:glycosyltransferase involved in cell wall biosynthesis